MSKGLKLAILSLVATFTCALAPSGEHPEQTALFSYELVPYKDAKKSYEHNYNYCVGQFNNQPGDFMESASHNTFEELGACAYNSVREGVSLVVLYPQELDKEDDETVRLLVSQTLELCNLILDLSGRLRQSLPTNAATVDNYSVREDFCKIVKESVSVPELVDAPEDSPAGYE